MADRLRERSGLPPQEELAAIEQRWTACRTAFKTSTLSVYPIRLWPGSDSEGAVALAALITKQGLCRATATGTDPQLQVGGDPNQQKVLWEQARAFREHLRGAPPASDYALLADYGIVKSASGEGKSIMFI